MPDIRSGAEALFGALAGGGGTYEAAKAKQELANINVGQEEADLRKKVDEATMKRDERLARENRAADLRAVLPEGLKGQADAFASLSIGSDAKFGTLGSGIDNFQKLGMRAQVPELLAPEIGEGNALLAAMAGKPLKTNDIDSGYQVNPYATGGAATPTSATTGKIINDALKADVYADTARDKSAAYVDKQYRPSGTGSQAKPPAYTMPAAARLNEVLANPGERKDFGEWQAEQAGHDTRYNDGDFALAQYTQGKPAMATESVDFGTGLVKLPAAIAPDAIQAVMAANRDRGANGMEPLTRAEQVSMVNQYKKTGTMAVPSGKPNRVRFVTANGIEDVQIKQDEKPLTKDGAPRLKSKTDRQKGNAGQQMTVKGSYTAKEVSAELRDARAAVASGLITREEAQRRLREAGLEASAKAL